MTIVGNKETGLNELSLESASVPGQTAKLNSIKLVKDSKSGLFNLTAGGLEDDLRIAGTQASFDSNNQWKGTKISLSEKIEKTYDITISYVDSGK